LPGDDEGDPARARPRCVRLDEERGVIVDVPQDLVSGAQVWGSPKEPRVPIDAGVEIGYRDTGDEVGDRALHTSPSCVIAVARRLAPSSYAARSSSPASGHVAAPLLVLLLDAAASSAGVGTVGAA